MRCRVGGVEGVPGFESNGEGRARASPEGGENERETRGNGGVTRRASHRAMTSATATSATAMETSRSMVAQSGVRGSVAKGSSI